MIPPAKAFVANLCELHFRRSGSCCRVNKGFIQMINTLRRIPALWAPIAIILFAAVIPAHSQAPTDAQRSVIRSQCRADYEAHCASIPPGGKASLQCLQQNMSSLSSGCQAAVRAVETPAAETAPATPKAESAPTAPAESAPAAAAKPDTETAAPPAAAKTAAAPKPAASTPAKKPSSAQVAAIRSACRSDYQQNCAGVPTGGAAALSCLEKNKPNLSANCQRAVNAAGGAAADAAGGAATAGPGANPAAAPAAALALRSMRPREVIFVLRSACSEDVRTLCAGVAAGGGRIIQCLATQATSLSPACSNVLSQFAAR
jgi:Cysteine rich repeat